LAKITYVLFVSRGFLKGLRDMVSKRQSGKNAFKTADPFLI
jgi:hypothetical protein